MTAIMRAQTVAVPMSDYAPNVKRFALVQRGTFYQPPLRRVNRKGDTDQQMRRRLATATTRGHLRLLRIERDRDHGSSVVAICEGPACKHDNEIWVGFSIWNEKAQNRYISCEVCRVADVLTRGNALPEMRGLFQRVEIVADANPPHLAARCTGPYCTHEKRRFSFETWVGATTSYSCKACHRVACKTAGVSPDKSKRCIDKTTLPPTRGLYTMIGCEGHLVVARCGCGVCAGVIRKIAATRWIDPGLQQMSCMLGAAAAGKNIKWMVKS